MKQGILSGPTSAPPLGQLPESVLQVASMLREKFGPNVRLLHAVNHATGEVHGRAIWDDVQAEMDERGRRR